MWRQQFQVNIKKKKTQRCTGYNPDVSDIVIIPVIQYLYGRQTKKLFCLFRLQLDILNCYHISVLGSGRALGYSESSEPSDSPSTFDLIFFIISLVLWHWGISISLSDGNGTDVSSLIVALFFYFLFLFHNDSGLRIWFGGHSSDSAKSRCQICITNMRDRNTSLRIRPEYIGLLVCKMNLPFIIMTPIHGLSGYRKHQTRSS